MQSVARAFKWIGLLLLISCTTISKAQLLINEFSQGASGNKEYIEFVVFGTGSCTDTCADLRGWIFDDNNGWYGTSAISPGCYRFKNDPNWACVPYGSIIVVYNNGDLNPNVPPADPTDANNDGVYVLPINSIYFELHNTLPSATNNTAYPSTGFGAAGTWTNIALNNSNDLIQTVAPSNLTQSYHAVGYGGMTTPVQVSGSGSQRVYYLTNGQYNLSAGWVSGTVPANETPGAPNTVANATWINAMGSGTGGVVYNDTLTNSLCQGDSILFGGVYRSSTGYFTTHHTTNIGCDSIITLALTVHPIPATPNTADSVFYCQNAIATALSAVGQNIKWYQSATGGTPSVQAPVPGTNVVGSAHYYVTQTINSCESSRKRTVVLTKPLPQPPLVDSAITVCKGTMPFTLTAQGQDLLWYTTAIGGTPQTVAPTISTNAGLLVNWYVTQRVNGCESSRSRIKVKVSEVIASFTINNDSLCLDQLLVATNTSTGNDGTQRWYLGDGSSFNTQNITHQYGASGLYNIQLFLENQDGCVDSAQKQVYIGEPIDLLFLKDRNHACPGEQIHFTGDLKFKFNSFEFDLGDGNTFYHREGIDTVLALDTKYKLSFSHAYDQEGIYYFKYTGKSLGCPLLERLDSIIVHPIPRVDLGSDTSLCFGGSPILLENKFEQLLGEKYLWSTGDTTLTSFAKHHGQYSLTINNNYCSGTGTVTITKDCYTDIPNSFTPNNDGVNDYFYPKQLLSAGVTAFEMTVWNRWGQVIFETNNPNGRGWDGRFNNVVQPMGVYIYQLKVTFKNGQHEKYQGNVTLLR